MHRWCCAAFSSGSTRAEQLYGILYLRGWTWWRRSWLRARCVAGGPEHTGSSVRRRCSARGARHGANTHAVRRTDANCRISTGLLLWGEWCWVATAAHDSMALACALCSSCVLVPNSLIPFYLPALPLTRRGARARVALGCLSIRLSPITCLEAVMQGVEDLGRHKSGAVIAHVKASMRAGRQLQTGHQCTTRQHKTAGAARQHAHGQEQCPWTFLGSRERRASQERGRMRVAEMVRTVGRCPWALSSRHATALAVSMAHGAYRVLRQP